MQDEPFRTKKWNTPISVEYYGRLIRYCNYRDRSIAEARMKAHQLGIVADRVDDYLTLLIEDDYLNEQRFIESYIEGKFRIKSWGRKKIYHKLRAKGIPREKIEAGFKTLSEDEYSDQVQQLISEYMSKNNGDNLKNRCYRHMLQKGYEAYVVYPSIYHVSLKRPPEDWGPFNVNILR